MSVWGNSRLPAFALTALMALALPLGSLAQFAFTTNNGAITITGYTGSPTNLIIPSTTNGWPVTSIGNNAFYNCTNLSSIIIPNSITTIAGGAFYQCTKLKAITIPESVTSIGMSTFVNCYSLTNVSLGSALNNIGQSAFNFCTNLPAITIPNNVTNIDSAAFYACFSLKNITIPDSVVNLGAYAFQYCYSLTNISMGNAITKIGDYTFQNCSSLRSLIIPSNVRNIGSFAFDGCSTLSDALIGSGVVNIGDNAFGYCNLTNITIPNSVTNLGVGVFQFCRIMTNVTFGSGVRQMGSSLFDHCYKLATINVDSSNPVFSSLSGILLSNQTTLIRCPLAKTGSVYIPDSVINIASKAFWECTNLTSITFGNGVASVGTFAFSYCLNVTDVFISSGQNNIAISWFKDLSALKAISVDANNQTLSSEDGVLFNQEKTTLLFYPPAKVGNYRVLSTVTSIGDQAFSGCNTITNVTIPSSVTSIGNSAFDCVNLKRIFFEGNPPNLGTQSFGTFVWPYWVYPTCYYLPGTTGWEPLLGGCVTVLWNPQVQTSNSNFGIKTNRFGFNLTGTTNIPIVIEGSTNFSSAWTPLITGTLTNGSIYFTDPQWTNYPQRFYRVRSP